MNDRFCLNSLKNVGGLMWRELVRMGLIGWDFDWGRDFGGRRLFSLTDVDFAGCVTVEDGIIDN